MGAGTNILQVPLGLAPLIPAGHEGPARVSVNSFGYGGTNCHVVLESAEEAIKDSHFGVGSANGYPVNGHAPNGAATNGNHVNGHKSNGTPETSTEEVPLLFPLTASSEAALDAMPERLHQWLSGKPPNYSTLKDLSYTLSCRRSLLRWRKTLVASNVEQLLAELAAQKRRKTRAALSAKVAFVFTGQGAQWAAMGRDLLSSSKTFRDSMEKSSSILKQLGCEWDLLEELAKPEEESRINESALAQPTTTILQIGLVDLLGEFGVRPQWVVGHSSGEIAGAYAAGFLSHEDAIRA
jgi:acyl transferase domain-containing protein